MINTQVPLYVCPSTPGDNRVQTGLQAFSGAPLQPTSTAAVGDYFACVGNGSLLSPNPDSYGLGALDARAPVSFAYGKCTLNRVTDGTSNTLIVSEDAGLPDKWVKGKMVGPHADPRKSTPWAGLKQLFVYTFSADGTTYVSPGAGACVINCSNEYGVYSFHAGGTNGLFLDGSVKFVKQSLSAQTLAALISRAGGEVLADDF